MEVTAAARRDYLWCGLSLLILLGMQFFVGAAAGVMLIFGLLTEATYEPVVMLVSTLGEIVPILFAAKLTHVSPRGLFRGEQRLEKWVPAGLLVLLGVSLLSGIAAQVITQLLAAAGFDLWTPGFVLPADLPGCVMMLLSTCILAPVFEETLFRGVLLRVFTRYNPRFAIFASALLFAFAHGNLTQGIGTFFIGIVFAWIAQRAGGILPTVMIHMFYNTYAMLINTASELPDPRAAAAANLSYFLIGMAGVIFAAVTYARKTPRLPPKSPEQKPFGFRLLLRSWPVIVFLAAMVLMAVVPALLPA